MSKQWKNMTFPIPTPIYHITHIDNLDSILKSGGLLSHNQKVQQCIQHRNIAHGNIQERRSVTVVPCGSGGTLHDYVPFFFAPKPPMLYPVRNNRVAGYTDGQDPIVYFVAHAQNVANANSSFVFTDGHATMTLSDFYCDLNELSKVDWDVMSMTYWNDTPDFPDRKRRRQAEFLVRDFLPWSQVDQIVVLNQERCQQVLKMTLNVSHKPVVSIKPDWYY